MPSAAPLRSEIERVFRDRPFKIEFWDGSSLPPTGGDGPTFKLQSRKAVGHALRAPGQLGIGRAYVSGDIAVDDLDAVMEVVGSWKPPEVDRADQLKLLVAAIRAAGPMVPASPLRPAARVLQALPGRVAGLLLRDLLEGRHHPRGGTAHQARPGVHEAEP